MQGCPQTFNLQKLWWLWGTLELSMIVGQVFLGQRLHSKLKEGWTIWVHHFRGFRPWFLDSVALGLGSCRNIMAEMHGGRKAARSMAGRKQRQREKARDTMYLSRAHPTDPLLQLLPAFFLVPTTFPIKATKLMHQWMSSDSSWFNPFLKLIYSHPSL